MEGSRLIPWRTSSQGQKTQPETGLDPGLSQVPSFEYTQLLPGCIRLLSPDPEAAPAGLAWRLQTVKLDEKLGFDALSYVWGSQASSHSILVNSQIYHVHPNLNSALPYLATRRKQEPGGLSIWIDAICINQQDKKEVAEQIALMHQVYRGARMVWVWLGLSKAQTEIPEAISLLHKINQTERKQSDAAFLGAQEEENDTDSFVVESNVWAAISHILGNQWYHRVWVMQEAALAKDLMFLCGEHEIRRETIQAVLHRVREVKLTDQAGAEIYLEDDIHDATGLFHTRRIVQNSLIPGNPRYSNDYMLMRVSNMMVTKDAQCLLAEDRIWGLMGLSTSTSLDKELRQVVEVDELYTRFSRYVLSKNDPNLGFAWWNWLELPFSAKRRDTLPSWVPDFHQAAARDTGLNSVSDYVSNELVFGKGKRYRASQKSTTFSLGEQKDEILLHGKRLEEVEDVLDYVQSLVFSGASLTIFQVLEYLCRLSDWVGMVDSYLDTRSSTRAYDNARNKKLDRKDVWRVVLKIRTESDVRNFNKMRSGLYKSKELAEKYVGANTNMLDADRKHTMNLYYSPTVSWLHIFQQKQIFWTKGDRFGFAKRGVQPGDSVCVFDGARVPHVLRKVDASEDSKVRWQFVGDAFVDGLMKGEADDMDVEGKEFCIV